MAVTTGGRVVPLNPLTQSKAALGGGRVEGQGSLRRRRRLLLDLLTVKHGTDDLAQTLHDEGRVPANVGATAYGACEGL